MDDDADEFGMLRDLPPGIPRDPYDPGFRDHIIAQAAIARREAMYGAVKTMVAWIRKLLS